METETKMNTEIKTDSDTAMELSLFQERFRKIAREINRVFVGHEELVTDLLVSLTAGGHILLEGVPGLGKTLLARTLAETLDLQFSRIQFTPDLMPADITGAMQLLENEKGLPELLFRPGPLMANFVLADEINRTTPKTQSALLEAMQEHQITAGEKTLFLPEPFTVIATQNPIEQDGTYPLPEAELDRFLMKLLLKYPEEEEYGKILDLTTGTEEYRVSAVCSGDELLQMRRTLRKVLAEKSVSSYAVRLVMATQPDSRHATKTTQKYLLRGAGPRAAQGLVLAAKAHALLDGRTAISAGDIRKACLPVMRHRISLNYSARAERITPDEILGHLLSEIGE